MITHNVNNVFTSLTIHGREQTRWRCYIVLFVVQQIETLHIEMFSCDKYTRHIQLHYSVLVYECKTEQGHIDKSLTASWATQKWSDLRLETIFRAAQRWDRWSLTFDLWVEVVSWLFFVDLQLQYWMYKFISDLLLRIQPFFFLMLRKAHIKYGLKWVELGFKSLMSGRCGPPVPNKITAVWYPAREVTVQSSQQRVAVWPRVQISTWCHRKLLFKPPAALTHCTYQRCVSQLLSSIGGDLNSLYCTDTEASLCYSAQVE